MTMTQPLRFGSVCSGIEAASVAWGVLGWEAAWFSEIEPFPSAVLAHHYPDVTNLGDMTALPDLITAGNVEAPDVLCGGTPCQAFSVAGLRKSLDDARGNLSLTFCQIADELDTARLASGKQPAIIFWENVPGVLSTKDNAFGCFLAGLAGESDPLIPPGGKWSNAGAVFGPSRAVAWRVFDAQYFGVAQRRRRVFVVASARNGFDPAAVLLEWDSMRRDSAPSRKPGQETAGTLASRTDGGGFPGTDEACSGYVQPVTAFGGNNTAGPISQAAALNANRWCHNPGDFEAGTLLVQQPVAFALQHAQIGRKDEAGPQGKGWQEEVAFTQDSRSSADAVVVAFQPGNLARGCGASPSTDVFPTLKADHGRGKSDQDPHVMHAMQVRRLTPVECERLQGFPDNYTAIPLRKKPASECPDGPRYKALGNSWAVPVVRWIGRRIANHINKKIDEPQ